MRTQKKKTNNAILTKLKELETLLRKKEDKPLNFNQAAQYLGFSHSYLYKLTSRKIIPCHRPTGKVLFFSKNELDEWIFENENREKSNVKRKKEKGRKLEDSSEDEEEEPENQ